jgi:hypothetical protein
MDSASTASWLHGDLQRIQPHEVMSLRVEDRQGRTNAARELLDETDGFSERVKSFSPARLLISQDTLMRRADLNLVGFLGCHQPLNRSGCGACVCWWI